MLDWPAALMSPTLDEPTLNEHSDIIQHPLIDVFRDVFTLIIRRGHCLHDMIKECKDPDILDAEICAIKMRLPNGSLEEGEGSGVTRDCFTEFWTDCYDTCILGSDV